MVVNGLAKQLISVTRRGPNRLLSAPNEIPFRSDRCLHPESVREVTQEPHLHRHVPPALMRPSRPLDHSPVKKCRHARNERRATGRREALTRQCH
jgi:hypothetical protein